MYSSNNYLNYNSNEFSSDLPGQTSFHNVNQPFMGNNAMKSDFDVSATRKLLCFFLNRYLHFFVLIESNELFCSSSSYPTSSAGFSIPAHASGTKKQTNKLE